MTQASWFTMKAIFDGIQLLIAEEEAKEEPNGRELQLYNDLIDLIYVQRLVVYIAEPQPVKKVVVETEPTEETGEPERQSWFRKCLRWLFGREW